ncbi:MAG: putative 4-mercaptohistidine N1-methyltransferase, partial [Bdellovibrionales bacterium]|nr:putative 4-mercaptohistidine N1-methyltransferase [Bdellovibrionales bacterium]
YKLRTTFEVIDMPWDWPVCVNYHEAKAYCAWRSERDKTSTPYRLLSESEHHVIRDSSTKDKSLDTKRDMVMTDSAITNNYNLNLAHGSESPVRAGQPNDKGFYDTFGNVWQWCEDYFHPLEGGAPHPYYDDFSAPCYDGKHQMMLGGSFISTGDEASIWARFHFRPHFFQHAGFRITLGEQEDIKHQDYKFYSYESMEMVNKYMLMHWGTLDQIYTKMPKVTIPEVVQLPVKCAELMIKYASKFDRSLDLGCAVGRSSFELAKKFNHVIGIDYSHEFINCANELKTTKQFSYWRKDSGHHGEELTCHIDASIDRNRLHFEQGDACNLSDNIKGYDAVLLANVLCRLPEPETCLLRMQAKENALVNKDGILVMTTPFSWLESYTPSNLWIDGVKAIQNILTEFELLHQEELPFLIREHSRKYEYIITLATVCKRK